MLNPKPDLVVLSVASLVAVSAMGCRRSEQHERSVAARVGTATLTGALVYVPSDIAREQIAQARCAHAMSCEQVGEGKRYGDLSRCTVQVQLELQSELGNKQCPAGVDEIALRECVDRTAHSTCNDDAEASASEACTVAKVCKTR